MNRILVTGGAGFLGSNLCRKLLEQSENQVICLDNLYTGRKGKILGLLGHDRFSFVEADVREVKLDFEIDEIYNAACPASPPAYQKDPVGTTETCVLGTKNMLELARKYGAKLVQFSTSEVYGNAQESPQREDYWGNVNPNGPRSCYDEGKRCAESLCFDFVRQYQTDVKVVRIFNTYGPNMNADDGRVVSNLIVQALKNEPMTMYGDGSQTRSFCYVDDLIDGLVRVMDLSEEIHGPINLGNPQEISIRDLVQTILRLTESQSSVICKPLPVDDPIRRQPDITRAKQLLQWYPSIGLEEGLRKTISYFQENGAI